MTLPLMIKPMAGEPANLPGRLAASWNGFSRASVLILGGLLVLQSSDELDVTKVAYLIAAIVCVTGSLSVLVQCRDSPEYRELRGLLLASVALGGVLVVSLPIALASGTSFANWIRDAANYGLVAITPVVALDAYRSSARRSLAALLLTAGGLSSLSYVAQWLNLRHIADIPLDRVALPSGQLTTALFVTLVGLSLAIGRWRLLWAAAVGIDMALFVLAGARARIPMLALPAVIAVLARPIGVSRLFASLLVTVATAIVAFTVLYGVVASGVSAPPEPPPTPGQSDSPGPTRTPNPLEDRIGSLPGLLTRLGSDPSFQERITQAYAAWDVFADSPILGSGPGMEISWVNYEGKSVAAYNLDTPILVAAKFGFIGAVIALGWTVALMVFALRLIARARTAWVTLTFAGFSVASVYSWIFAPPYEDKGFAFALIPLLALGLAELGARDGGSLAARGAAPSPPPGHGMVNHRRR